MTTLIGYGLIISLVTILVRMLRVFTGAYFVKWMSRNKSNAGDDQNADDTWKNVLIVAWTGTRGVISMATALVLSLLRLKIRKKRSFNYL